ncbi:catalase [Roseomonas sp. E05]|uniref:catalase n=1 Tax=Roseomonas sp. E05 TaxID=3046310 RepID=UPI0024B9BBC5|nr:catalase [Roseomonas sp. E05]MDJ0389987.1 catalase [Roseomonas sp. E05]
MPVLVRFSNFAAVPGLPDGDPAASPRGMAIKFLLPDEVETDIVAHSYDGFPAATPEAFLAFLRALPDPAALQALAAVSPAVRIFLDDPKPAPASYATEAYFGVNAFRFSNAAGEARLGRYRILPLAGLRHLNAEQAAARPAHYLATELRDRLIRSDAAFRLQVQLAGPGDPTDDGTRPWPQDRRSPNSAPCPSRPLRSRGMPPGASSASFRPVSSPASPLRMTRCCWRGPRLI